MKNTRLAGYCALPPTFKAFLHTVIGLRHRLRAPHTLRDLKVDGGKRNLIAGTAIVDPTAGGIPLELTKFAPSRCLTAQ